MKKPGKRVLLLSLLVGGILASPGICHGDTVYVWSGDETIKRFETNGTFTVLTNGFSGWNGPVGLATDAWGNLYAGIPGDSRIWRFTPEGLPTLVGGMVDSVSALAFDAWGALYATIPNYRAVVRLTYVPGWGYGLDPRWPSNYSTAHLSLPTSLAFDQTGNFFVANNVAPYPFTPGSYSNTVEQFSPAIVYLGTFATNLNQPWGLAFDKAGNLFVSNSGTNGYLRNTILKFTPDGVRSTFAFSGLSSPQGLAFDSTGNLYVASAGNGTIQKLTPGGASSIFASGLNSPCAIAIHPGIKFWRAKPVVLAAGVSLRAGAFHLSFTNTPTLSFNAFAATNLSLPASNWTLLGRVPEVAPGQFQFTDLQVTNSSQRFYRVISP